VSALLDARSREHFETLSQDEQRAAIYDLCDRGYSDHTVAHATRLSLEQVRQVLGDRLEGRK
jgi:hypothetical protein